MPTCRARPVRSRWCQPSEPPRPADSRVSRVWLTFPPRTISHVKAPVDGPDLAGDVGRRIGAEEVHAPGHLLRLAEPSERYLLADPVEDFLGNRGEHVGGDEARGDRVDRHTERV